MLATSLVIYGGTFDPPHYGHLNTAQAVQAHLSFDRFIFLPCKLPVLKNAAYATAEERLEMLKLALAEEPTFEIDTREMMRNTPSFMSETLKSFRHELGPETSISICLGLDAFMQFTKWHQWETILALGNLLVMQRANINESHLEESVKKLLYTCEVFNKQDLLKHSSGKIYRFDAGYYPVSSTWIRNELQLGHRIEGYLPARVYEFIREKQLYR